MTTGDQLLEAVLAGQSPVEPLVDWLCETATTNPEEYVDLRCGHVRLILNTRPSGHQPTDCWWMWVESRPRGEADLCQPSVTQLVDPNPLAVLERVRFGLGLS